MTAIITGLLVAIGFLLLGVVCFAYLIKGTD